MTIQLLTFADCANAPAARELLRRVIDSSGPDAGFQELDTRSSDTPEPYRSYPSPTILVDGVPVGGSVQGDGRCCQLYLDDSGRRLVGVPSEAVLRTALARAVRAPHGAAT